VVLGSSTRIAVGEGPPGFDSASLDLASGLEPAEMPDPDDEGYVSDPDGRRFKISATDRIEKRLTDPEPRLGHLTFESPDPILQQGFFEALGFMTSEGLGQDFRWLRCNPIHHTVAFARAPEPGIHHVAIELPDRSALIDACDHIAGLDHYVQYGPGRHLVGNNLFVYFLDRHGIRFELFCELERVYPHDREPLIRESVDRTRSINIWGPQPPEAYWQGV
jgi:catechol 2,3-dioxygenase-like lactoylglutathione lyase family enzyme